MKEVIIISLLAALLGGTGRLLNILRHDPKTTQRTYIDVLSVYTNSLIATALVPSISGLLSSTTLNEVTKDWTKQLVLFGFCLGAALLGERFTNPLLNRIQSQLGKIEHEQSALIEVMSEPSNTRNKSLKMSEIEQSQDQLESSEVLLAFRGARRPLRSFEGLNQAVSLPPAELKKILDKLVQDGVLGTLQGVDGEVRWFLKD